MFAQQPDGWLVELYWYCFIISSSWVVNDFNDFTNNIKNISLNLYLIFKWDDDEV